MKNRVLRWAEVQRITGRRRRLADRNTVAFRIVVKRERYPQRYKFLNHRCHHTKSLAVICHEINDV